MSKRSILRTMARKRRSENIFDRVSGSIKKGYQTFMDAVAGFFDGGYQGSNENGYRIQRSGTYPRDTNNSGTITENPDPVPKVHETLDESVQYPRQNQGSVVSEPMPRRQKTEEKLPIYKGFEFSIDKDFSADQDSLYQGLLISIKDGKPEFFYRSGGTILSGELLKQALRAEVTKFKGYREQGKMTLFEALLRDVDDYFFGASSERTAETSKYDGSVVNAFVEYADLLFPERDSTIRDYAHSLIEKIRNDVETENRDPCPEYVQDSWQGWSGSPNQSQNRFLSENGLNFRKGGRYGRIVSSSGDSVGASCTPKDGDTAGRKIARDIWHKLLTTDQKIKIRKAAGENIDMPEEIDRKDDVRKYVLKLRIEHGLYALATK